MNAELIPVTCVTDPPPPPPVELIVIVVPDGVITWLRVIFAPATSV